MSATSNLRGGMYITAFVMTASTLGCTKTPPTEGAAGSANTLPTAVASAPAPAPSASVAAAAPVERMTAPLKLVVKGPTPPPAKGEFKVSVDIVANEALKKPLTLKIELPTGARLVKGASEESLTIKEAGTTAKEYTFRTDAPLTAPIVFTAEMKDDTGGMGLRAQRKYPSGPETAASSNAPTSSSARPPALPK